MFTLILAFSNYLSKTGIHGFKLNSLQKLKDTKGSINSKTCSLLDVLAKHISSSRPDILKVKEELSMLERAARVEYQTLAEKIDSIEKAINLLRLEIQFLSKNAEPKDSFVEVFSPFLTESEDELRIMQERQKS